MQVRLCRGLHRCAKLAQIAPTALFQPKTRGDRKFVVFSFADAAGATAGLQTARSAYDARVADVRSRFAAQLTDNVWIGYSFGYSDSQFSVQFPTQLWKSLPVARTGRDYGVTAFYGVSGYSSAVLALDELEQQVLMKLT